MMKVKIIRTDAKYLEQRINEFFQSLNLKPGYKYSNIQLQVIHLGSKDLEEAVIMYNEIAPKPVSAKPTNP